MKIPSSSIAIVLSVSVHIALASVFLDTVSDNSGNAVVAGEGGLDVGLGMAGSYVDRQPVEKKSLDKKISEQAPEPEILPKSAIEQPVKAIAKQSLTPTPKETLVESQKAKHQLVIDEEPVASTPKEQVAPLTNRAQTTENDEPESQQQQPQKMATGKANSQQSGAKVGDNAHYFGEIMAWLAHYKRYPAKLKKNKIEGVVSLQFKIDRNGYLLSSEIKKSSGHSALDRAALEMLTNASPLPAMPHWMKRDTLTLVIPVEYSLITNRSHKE